MPAIVLSIGNRVKKVSLCDYKGLVQERFLGGGTILYPNIRAMTLKLPKNLNNALSSHVSQIYTWDKIPNTVHQKIKVNFTDINLKIKIKQ